MRKGSMNRGKRRLLVMLGLIVLFSLMVTALCYATDLSGAFNSAQSELNSTLAPIPKLIKPIFYLFVGLASLAFIASRVFKLIKDHSDDQMTKKCKDQIIGAAATGIIVSVAAPALVQLVNLLFKTNLQW